MPNEVYTEEQCAAYNFGDAAAPEGFDPNASGWLDPPPGDHVFVVDTYGIAPNHVFRWDKQEWILNQLRPTLIVAEGPAKGCKIMDFLPMPTPGQPMAAGLANKWANFVKALGFDIPADKTVPHGFQLPMIKNRKFRARIVVKMEQDGRTPKIGKKGLPMVEVDFFGYSRLDANGSPPATSRNGAARPPVQTPPATTPAAKPFDPMSDL